MIELEAQPAGQVPVASRDVRAAVDDGRRHGPTVGRVAEGDPGAARQRPMGDADDMYTRPTKPEHLRHRPDTSSGLGKRFVGRLVTYRRTNHAGR